LIFPLSLASLGECFAPAFADALRGGGGTFYKPLCGDFSALAALK